MSDAFLLGERQSAPVLPFFPLAQHAPRVEVRRIVGGNESGAYFSFASHVGD